MKLSAKLLVVIITVAVVCIGIATAFVYTSMRTALQNEISNSQLEVAKQTASKVDRLLYNRLTDIRGLAQQEQVGRYLSNRITPAATAAAVANLNAYRSLTGNWSEFSLLDLSGQVKTGTDQRDIGAALLSQHADIPTLYQRAKAGEVVYSDALLAGDNEVPTIIYMAPVRLGGSIVGVVQGEISWPAVLDILAEIHGSTAFLLNQDGLFLGSNKPNLKQKVLTTSFKSSAAFAEAKGQAGSSTIAPSLDNAHESALTTSTTETGFHDYRGNGWVLLLSVPTRVAFAPAQNLTLMLLAIIMITIIIGIAALIYTIQHQILRPVRNISSAVARVTLGDLTQTVPVVSHDELGSLGRNFNEMTYQLAATHRNLEASSLEAQQGRARLESSINGLRQGFILTDYTGRPIMLNTAAQHMVAPHSRAKSAATTSLETMFRLLPAELKLADQIAKTIKTGHPAKFPALPLGGRFLNLYLSPVSHDKNTIGCVLLFEDITEELIMQRSRDEFFSIASHELRTPLTAIRGNTSLIQQYYPEALKDTSLNEMISDIHDSSIRLIEIVNDFLDASRLEQDKMQFDMAAFSIEPVVEKVIYELGANVKDKGIHLTFDKNLGSLPLVWADVNRIKQIVYNLVGNAMKFTEKGGVNVTAEVKSRQLKVLITDTGLGISPEGQQLLFHKFQQTGSSILTRDVTRGTGLGLYISKLLVEHMDGAIALERSEVGKGSTFSFTVPLATKTQIAATKQLAKPLTTAAPQERAAINPESRDQAKSTGSGPQKTV